MFVDMFYCLFSPVMIQNKFYYELTPPAGAEDGWARLLSGMVNESMDISVPSFEAVHSLDQMRYKFREKQLEAFDVRHQSIVDDVAPGWHVDEVSFHVRQDGHYEGQFFIRLDFEDGWLRSMRIAPDVLKKAA